MYSVNFVIFLFYRATRTGGQIIRNKWGSSYLDSLRWSRLWRWREKGKFSIQSWFSAYKPCTFFYFLTVIRRVASQKFRTNTLKRFSFSYILHNLQLRKNACLCKSEVFILFFFCRSLYTSINTDLFGQNYSGTAYYGKLYNTWPKSSPVWHFCAKKRELF